MTAQQLSSGGHTLGPADAPDTLVEFADFQCPFCARLEPALRALELSRATKVAVIFRHFPLTEVHPHAYQAALATECAADEGRFAALHDLLFAVQDSIGLIPWEELARRAGVVHLRTFLSCLAAQRYRSRVDSDIAAGRAERILGTPTLVANDRSLDGTATEDDLRSLLRRMKE